MRLLLCFLILTSAARSEDIPAPFACNLKVFQPEERKQHIKLSHEVMGAVLRRRELPQGYEFELDPTRVSLIELAEWVGREKKCCPFFDFQISLEGANEGKLSLAPTGRAGVKQFILEEFPLANARGSVR
jgi:hypothetical protein